MSNFQKKIPTVSICWELVQPNYCASLYGEVILVILEPKILLGSGSKAPDHS